MKEATIIGLISDTHGLVRPEVFAALDGVSRIFHAGDVGPPEVLIELATIAPIQAVWGNTDAPGRSDLVDFIVARILDHLDVEHRLGKRWGGEDE